MTTQAFKKEKSILSEILDSAKIARPRRVTLGQNSRIDDFCLISTRLKTGDNVAIHSGTKIVGHKDRLVRIGDNSVITYNCVLVCSFPKHTSHMSTMISSDLKNVQGGNIIIGDEVFIGSGSIIVGPCRVPDGVVIGAQSFINKDLQPWTVYIPNRAPKPRKFEDRLGRKQNSSD